MPQTDSMVSNESGRSLLTHGIPKNLKMEVHEGGIGFLSGDIHNYINKLYINLATEDLDADQLKIPFKQLKKAMVVKPPVDGNQSWTKGWCGLLKIGLVFVLVQVLLFVMFITFYSPSVDIRFPYTESSFPEIPVGVVMGANTPGGPSMFERDVWLAQPPVCMNDPHRPPARKVVIHHTEGEDCTTVPDCAKKIRYIQQFHIASRNWCDIAFNFLIGGDGNVYEGVGWNFMGSHTKGHNNRSLGIAFVGTFSTKLPNDRQIEAFQKLIHVGIALEKVERNHTVMAFCQLATVSSSPGWALAHNLTSWKNFDRSLPIQCTKPPAAAKNKEEL